ncbi:MAG TPA: nicotinate (nicotinamide) nucleotide adenylyltransferase [Gemmatimonadaceae bacterium]|nr:nicotinate (nicotinamide) nucleotide adenylyltransferase [Gemmatimonadaceae bacterium]
MRIGLFGGSFDPPHLGHWLAAVDAFEQLQLDRLDFIPASRQPLKAEGHSATAADRVAMLEAMVGSDARFAVNPVEIDRGGLSFTVDTAASYRVSGPDDSLFLLLGTDAASRLDSWKEPERLLRLVQLVVLTRGAEAFAAEGVGRDALVLSTRRVDVSSTEVRRRAGEGRSLRGFVLDAVAEQIRTTALYR